MKNMERVKRCQSYKTGTFIASIAAAKVIRQPFSESDIVELHNIFLTNGFHLFKTITIAQGRSIIYTFLDSLDFYHNVGCLSSYHEPVSTVTNLLSMFADVHQPLTKEIITEFLLETFFFDFFWIEATPALLESEFFYLFQESVLDLNLHRTLPIVVLT